MNAAEKRITMAGCITILQRMVLILHRSLSVPGVRMPMAQTGRELRYAPNRAFFTHSERTAGIQAAQPSPNNVRPAWPQGPDDPSS